jgi:glutathione synthase
MRPLSILVLTDHSAHSANNSVYGLCEALRLHPRVGRLHLASRANQANREFFLGRGAPRVEVWAPRRPISHARGLRRFTRGGIVADIRRYNVIWLRLPRPIPDGFFAFLSDHVDERHIINRPSGIVEVANKAFLLNYPELCPPMRLCRDVADIWRWQQRFAIVLKPLENYGGRGVVKVRRGWVYTAGERLPFSAYLPEMEAQMQRGGYLAMKFLRNVRQGDKRIIVVNGQILGAVLRTPAKGAWLCNVAQGGAASLTRIEPEEQRIVETLNPGLLARGIAMYGIDTLVDASGRRVLSEINALSVGGIAPMAELSGLPLLETAASLLVEYLETWALNAKAIGC